MEFFVNFTVSTTVIYMMYPPIAALLSTTPKFKNYRRPNYVVKNIIKSITLPLLLAYVAISMEISLKDASTFDNALVRRVASAYVANDLVGLLQCELPITTRIHHIVSCLFLIYAHTIDFNNDRDAKALFFYTLFSAVAFPVNLYLGLRHCFASLPVLHNISKYIYLCSLLMNWGTQVVLGLGSPFYMFLLMFIVYDDVVLLRWLWGAKQLTSKK